MGLIELIQRDIKAITSNGSDFGVSMTFVSPLSVTATINGLHSKHTLSQDTEGNRANINNAHVSFSESSLTALGYPTRNNRDEFDMIGHMVTVADSTGEDITYKISENYPDETVGLMVCILKLT
jgi:hypothetical protein